MAERTPPIKPPSTMEIVKFRLLHEAAKRPSLFGFGYLIHAYTVSADERRRHVLIPTRDTRLVPTGLAMEVPEEAIVLTRSPNALFAQRLEAAGYEEIEGQLHIKVRSFSHESINLPNETPIAIFHFSRRMIPKVEIS